MKDPHEEGAPKKNEKLPRESKHTAEGRQKGALWSVSFSVMQTREKLM